MTRPVSILDGSLSLLRGAVKPGFLDVMAGFGIRTDRAIGVPVTELRRLARSIEPSNDLAAQLWHTGIHEARLLASIVAVPESFPREVADIWVGDIDSWDICDMACNNLFRRTGWPEGCVERWAADSREFVRRAGFALYAVMAAHRREHATAPFSRWLELIQEHSTDDRPMVRKAVNWALRETGKRCPELWPVALRKARELADSPCASARWIGKDAVRELTSDAVRHRLGIA
jgi:3-methyladenine DNA glycosylase AlkD